MNRILIVDDKEDNLYYLQALLTGSGFTVESARHGADALTRARQSPPDMVVSDLLMPVMDGYSLLRHWKCDDRLRSIPFVVYTATYTEDRDEQLAYDLGADAFILKATEPEEFLRKLREVRAPTGDNGETAARGPVKDGHELMKGYSEVLIRKLEEKALQLEEANQALKRDIARSREMENSLAAAQRIAKIGSWEINVATGEKSWSQQIHRIFETDPATYRPTREGFFERIHPEDRAKVEKAFSSSYEAGGTHEIQHRITFPGDRFKHVLERWEIFPEDHENPARAIGTCRDITERVESERQIRHTANLLHAVADGTSDAIFVKDLEGRYLFVNAAASYFAGKPADEVLGRDDTALFSEEDARVIMESDRKVLETGKAITKEETLTAAGTTRVYSATKAPYRDSSGNVIGTIGISRDVTEQKALESQFLRAQRMESIGTLAGGIAHDLNNVLAPIMMSIDLLKHGEEDPKNLKILSTIDRSAKRGADMVKQVLAFARGVETQQQNLGVGRLLREIENICNETFLKHIVIRCETPDDLWPVDGDPTQLHQILLNLAVNARDAMPKGGTLNLSARNIVLDEQYISMNIEAVPGPHVVIQVEDNGEGMPPDVVDRIFEPFFTTKEFGKGTGLGLSTTIAIAKSHGGFVRVYSEVGAGTQFRVYLPALNEVADDKEASTVKELPRGKGELVLVVDDEAAVREITSQTLQTYGYRVLQASDGAEATAICAKEKDGVDVIVCDMMMPTMDGPTSLRAISGINPKIRLIAASGLSSSATLAKVTDVGVEHFLPKPFTARMLLTTLRAALDH